MLVYGFVKDHKEEGKQALVLPEEKVSNEKYFELIDSGFVCVLNNNFASIQAAYDYLENGYVDDENEESQAYEKGCAICKTFTSVGKATGSRWHHGHEKFIVFKGCVCDQCAQDNFKTLKWIH